MRDVKAPSKIILPRRIPTIARRVAPLPARSQPVIPKTNSVKEQIITSQDDVQTISSAVPVDGMQPSIPISQVTSTQIVVEPVVKTPTPEEIMPLVEDSMKHQEKLPPKERVY